MKICRWVLLAIMSLPNCPSDASKVCSFPDLYPRQYVAYYTDTSPTIDGNLDEQVWSQVGWSEPFVDIRGYNYEPKPRFNTQVKMRWDSSFLYVAAFLQESQIWANITKNNEVIFNDNDFEVFVDAASSTHFYKELEINAAAATWALCLNKPYANGGYENSSRVFPGNGWGLSASAAYAVSVEGVLNVPGDEDRGWRVELALPLQDLIYNNTSKKPAEGTLWRINFSRVEWTVRAVEAHFEKVANVPEDNWVWSPQGFGTGYLAPTMHLPERWGFLQFADGKVNGTGVKEDAHWTLRCLARFLYEAQEAFKFQVGVYASGISELEAFDSSKILATGQCQSALSITMTQAGYTGRIVSVSGSFEALISQDRLLVIQPTSETAQ